MKLTTFSVRNFRRLNRVHVNLEPQTTIFVGANNSGKTSATHIFKLMLGGSKDKFTIHDFSASCWATFCEAGEVNLTTSDNGDVENLPDLPKICLDFWLKVDADNIHNVIDLLPSLEWDETPVGVRISLEPKNTFDLLSGYKEAKNNSTQTPKEGNAADESEDKYQPWPKDLFDFLYRNLLKYYCIRHYVLDYSKIDEEGFIPDSVSLKLLGDKNKSGEKIINELVRVDYLNAQRHLSDDNQSERGQNLSRRFSRFYQRNLDQKEDDFDTIKMLSKAQEGLDEHYAEVFSDTLTQLETLGYPGIENPKILIKSVLSAESILSKDTHIQYDLSTPSDTRPLSLPDRYNGLGFKNLIFMLVELLDFQASWLASDNKALLHIIFIEEPEAHLHAQLQKVFIEKIRVATKADELGLFEQHIVTTHSSHILYDSGFKPIRYFRRKDRSHKQATDIVDLSKFTADETPKNISFLQRYMKLTHCDLFFADTTILVEGNVERLLLPLFVEKSAPALLSRYVSVLEVGGAHMHRFLPLLEFIGLPALLITDIDSVDPASNRSSCQTWLTDAETGNTMLRNHFPKLNKISELAKLSDTKKEQELCPDTKANLRVAYQHPCEISLGDETSSKLFGRTIEEQFAYENFAWLQLDEQKCLNLIATADTLGEKCEELFKRVNGGFKKADFALELMALEKDGWVTPAYIGHGLQWLDRQLFADTSDTETPDS